MPEVVVSENTPALFFRDQLITAMEHQRVSTSAFTECYLVNLLSAFAKGETLPSREPGFDETPLALLYARALTATRFERVVLLRSTADTALFVSGFFVESLRGGPADRQTSVTTQASAAAPTHTSGASTSARTLRAPRSSWSCRAASGSSSTC